MLKRAFDYHLAIDNVTGNKNLKLRKYELDDDDWEIISDLIQVLKVSACLFLIPMRADH